MKLRLGIVTPVVHINPRFEPPSWESTGTIEDVIAVAKAAERFGFDWVASSEHIAIPKVATDVRGPRYWDPTTTLAFVAAHTERIKLLSHVVVLGYHHPLELIKRWGTLDVASHGRVILGVGVGSLEPEFELLGHQFDGRGERSDDALRAIRASWGVREPVYSGTHFEYSGFVVDPCGLPRPLDIWVGGRTRRSLRRGLELGDGWIPFRLKLDDLRPILGDPKVRDAMAARDRPFNLIFPPDPPLDPAGAPAQAAEVVGGFAELGATGLSLRFRHHSRSHYIEQLQAMSELVATL